MTGRKKSTTVFEAMWDGYKEEHLKCEGNDCEVYSSIMVKNDWVAEDCGMYLCNICMLKSRGGSRMVGALRQTTWWEPLDVVKRKKNLA